tara:strand:+ start:2051 stop:2518 length:468 start_codon:yes stop_codon:yes gene_type:complete
LDSSLREKRVKQFEVIVNDTDYLPKDNTFRPFIQDMHTALSNSKRKITPKMNDAITKIVKRYAIHLKVQKDPKVRAKQLKFLEESFTKLELIKQMLLKCQYTEHYNWRTEDFLSSIDNQLRTKKFLSVGQRKALNQMYKRFDKRLDVLKKKGLLI